MTEGNVLLVGWFSGKCADRESNRSQTVVLTPLERCDWQGSDSLRISSHFVRQKCADRESNPD
ncbi:hypothetical protein [Halogranum gelatinilyticum]|uniref:hypothetical protein n=1 Tax=Halogranum gelatinilyticum TaxID=660521 RepID=UPI0011137917|nr:hypothetical protein [Halogranum gelatinilyticum]